ncbi:hypothetical protein PLICRDRAFT_31859 [Plicaturopsis crispa FD-325 SS-3]|uniref:CRAL-TRIO domain-containing protein n=1 Tax=Plicaturopsis crispa FD-325 SS-3 TaxID=944288 RepID=A0A0C9SRT4_PLICR|nr:hypothetical protein PLICRDRAFT_31859 [Plicaturopsis crispa FD-325 SS-3]
MSTPVYTPIPPPATPANAKAPESLTESQDAMYQEVYKHFSSPDYALPDLEDGKLTEEEKFWLSQECMLRYLRASKWHVDTAIKRVTETLKWRRDFGVYGDDLSAKHVEPEAVTGKEVMLGFDSEGRPGVYLLPSRQNTEESPRQVQFTVWMLEKAIDIMGPGVESLALLINFGDRGSKNPSMAQSRRVLNILQDHYPERLGRALIINVPFLVNAFLKLIMPFVDPITRMKIKFNPDVVKDGFFAADNVMESWGGTCNFQYEHEQYWPALVAMCAERKKANMERWRALGGTVGLKEWDYKQESESKTSVLDEQTLAAAPAETQTVEATAA